MALSEKTKVQLPLAVIISLAITVAGFGVTYGMQKSEADSQKSELVRIEREGKERDERSAKLVDELQRALVKMMNTMERLDERSVMTQRDISEIKRQVSQ